MMLLKADFVWLRSKGSHRIYEKGRRRVVVPFHSSATLHPKIVKQSSTLSRKPRPIRCRPSKAVACILADGYIAGTS
jgi:HicA toxin of bacterial toxin-antitoxin,